MLLIKNINLSFINQTNDKELNILLFDNRNRMFQNIYI